MHAAEAHRLRLVDELYEAVRSRDVAAVTTLLDCGADPNIKAFGQYGEGCYCLNWACMDDEMPVEIVDLLLSRNADPNVYDGRWIGIQMGRFPLFSACERNDGAVAQKLIDAGARVNDKFDGKTPLYAAVGASRVDRIEAVRVLLEAGADPNMSCSDSWYLEPIGVDFHTPLHQAGLRKKKQVLVKLLEYGADPNAVDSDGVAAKETWRAWFASDEAKEAMKVWRHKHARKEVGVLSHIHASQHRTFPGSGLPLLPKEVYGEIAKQVGSDLWTGDRTVADFRGGCADWALVDFGGR